MSWSHFTTLLAEGDIITEAQRNELYDAFLERAEAVGPWLSVTYAASSDLRTSGFATDLIERSSGAAVRLLNAISTISAHYIRPEVIDSAPVLGPSDSLLFFGSTADTTNLFNLAATAAGVTVAEFDDLDANPTLHAWRRWNVIREALRLLKYPRLKTVGAGAVWGIQVTDVTWADIKTAFFAYPESSGYVPGATSGLYIRSYDVGVYDISANRRTQTLSFPAITPFTAGYDIYGLISRGTDDNVGGDITVLFDGAYVSAGGFPFYDDRQMKLIGSGAITGNQDLDASMAAYYNSGAMDAYETDIVTAPDLVGSADIHVYVAAPTFTHT